jgi:hypothetical protein
MNQKFYPLPGSFLRMPTGLPLKKLLQWLLLVLGLITLFGCKKMVEEAEASIVNICPVVVSTNPVNGGTGISLTTKVDVVFNVIMDSATINAMTFTLKKGNTPVAGSIRYSSLTATFTPAAALEPNTVYTGTMTARVQDLAHSYMVADYVWSFTTGAGPDVTAPTVTSTDPVNAATGIALNTKVSAGFSEVMDSASVVSNFTLANTSLGGRSVPGFVSYSGTTAVFKPLNNLLPNTTYTGTVATGAKDLAGNTLVSNYTWSFTTGNSIDGTSPMVIATVPTSGATNVNVNTKVAATFSKAMDPASINFTSFTVKQGTTAVAGIVTYNGVIATFSPSTNLVANTLYTATITMAAKDLAGNTLAADYTWSFTTGSALDAVAPRVIATDPLNNAVDVPFDKKITATFSEAMDPLTINTATYTLKNGNVAVTGTVTYAGNTATFNPSASLSPSTKYTATITTGTKDLAGNALAANYTWSFTTDVPADIIAPTVTSTDPANNAVNVAINKKITATFSEAMDPATMPTSFRVTNNGVPVAGTVSYTGRIATFTPSVNLLLNTVYEATIVKTATDIAGNAMAADYVWHFTTVPPTINGPALNGIADFGAFGGNAGITNQGINTVINGSIGSTSASTLTTGFHEGLSGDVYTETPLNKGNVTGRIYTGPPAPGTATSLAIATQALVDANIAYNNISPASRPGGTDPGAGELGGLTLAAGTYQAAGGTFKITNGNLTLDAKGDPNALWVFQTAAGLTVGIAGAARSVVLLNGAQAKNVFWYVGSAATINGAGGGIMVGTIISSAGITFSTAGNTVQTVLNGRAISLIASVTMVNTTINVPN